jgi:hypothetical protein
VLRVCVVVCETTAIEGGDSQGDKEGESY